MRLTPKRGPRRIHQCGFDICSDEATELVADVFPEHPIFKSGAGLVCKRHADECQRQGMTVSLSKADRKRLFG